MVGWANLAGTSGELTARYVTGPTKETQAEAKVVKEVLGVAMKKEDALDDILKK